jgi:hypothetical protein
MIKNAMARFEGAASIHLDGNDESILRWNRCARLMHNLPREEEQKEAVGLYVAHGVLIA